jgi:RIO-like serine/threonine protein kinase
MRYLQERGFPVATPFAAAIEKLFILRRLYLITVFEEDAVGLLEYLHTCKKRERMRAVVRLAELLWGLKQAGVYHRDLHLRNVLVTRENRLILLDFDRAVKKPLIPTDVESMIRRLGRFTEKMERQGRLRVGAIEKALFLRAYARLSGYDMTEKMKRSRKMRGLMHRVGWFIESLLFGGRK